MTRFRFHAPAILLLSLSSLVAQEVGHPVSKAINDFLSANPNRTVQIGSRGVTVYGPAIWSKGQPIETLAQAREHAKGALRRYADLGDIPARRLGRRRVFTLEDLDAFIESLPEYRSVDTLDAAESPVDERR